MGEILVYYFKNSVIFLNALFFVKKWPNNKNLDIIMFAYSREVQKSLFHCNRPKSMQVMGVCFHHIKTIVHN